MTGQSLVLIENNFKPLLPSLQQAFPTSVQDVDAQRLLRSLMIACERNDKLAKCSMQSLVNGVYSAACLGLPIDGVTGQASLVPYGGAAQLQIEFKGYRTLAARAGFVIEAGLIYEDDKYEIQQGSGGYIKVWPSLASRENRRIIAAWAEAKSASLPSVIEIMTRDEIDKAASVSKRSRGSDSPWVMWYGEMAKKTICKRIAKSIPNAPDLFLAARLDDSGETGRSAYIRPSDKALIIDADTTPTRAGAGGEQEIIEDLGGPKPPDEYIIVWPDGTTRSVKTGSEYEGWITKSLPRATAIEVLDKFEKNNAKNLNDYGLFINDNVKRIRAAIERRRIELSKPVEEEI